jgi:hypothetical protein
MFSYTLQLSHPTKIFDTKQDFSKDEYVKTVLFIDKAGKISRLSNSNYICRLDLSVNIDLVKSSTDQTLTHNPKVTKERQLKYVIDSFLL